MNYMQKYSTKNRLTTISRLAVFAPLLELSIPFPVEMEARFPRVLIPPRRVSELDNPDLLRP
jgi:hypothetical protein